MDFIDRQQSSQQSQVNPWFQFFRDIMVKLLATLMAYLLVEAFKSLIKWFFAERSQRESRVESGFQLKSKKKRLKDEEQNSGWTQENSGRTQGNIGRTQENSGRTQGNIGRTQENSGRIQGNSGRTQENTTQADGVRDP